MSKSLSSITTATTANITGNLTVSGATNTLNFATGVIGTTQLAVDSVNATSLANTTITGSDVAAGTIQGSKVAATTILTGNIASATLVASNFANATIASADIALGTVTTSDFANGSVTGAVVASGTLTGASFGTAAVTTAKMASSGVAGSILVGNGTSMTNLSPGTSGQVLQVSGGTAVYGGLAASITGALASEYMGNAGPISTTVEHTYLDTNKGALPEWYISVYGNGNGSITEYSPVIDSAGNIYILRGNGTSSASFNIYDQPYQTTSGITSPITTVNYLLVKYSSAGVAQWSAGVSALQSTSNTTGCADITIDSSNNIYIIIGNLASGAVTTYSAPNAGTAFGTFTPGTTSTILVKYNSSGVVQWHTKIVGSTNATARPCIACDGTNVYIAKAYNAQVDFYSYSTPTTFTGPSSLVVTGSTDNLYIVKYTAATGALNLRTRITQTNMTIDNPCLVAYGSGVLLSFYGVAAATATLLIYSDNGTTTGTLWRTIPTAALTSGRGHTFLIRWTTALAGQQSTYIATNDVQGTVVMRPSGVCTDGTNIYLMTHGQLASAGVMQVYSDSAGVTPTSFGTLATYSAGNVENNNPIGLVKYNTSLVAQLMTKITLGSITNDIAILNPRTLSGGSPGSNYLGMATLSTTHVYVAFTADFNATNPSDIEFKGYTQPGTVVSNSRIVSPGVTQNGCIIKYTSALVCDHINLVNSVTYLGSPLTSANAVYAIATSSAGFGISDYYIYGDTGYIYNNPSVDEWLIKYNESLVRELSLANGASVPLNKTVSLRNELYSANLPAVINVTTMISDFGTAYTVITMNTKGETITLRWNGTYWNVVKNNGASLT